MRWDEPVVVRYEKGVIFWKAWVVGRIDGPEIWFALTEERALRAMKHRLAKRAARQDRVKETVL